MRAFLWAGAFLLAIVALGQAQEAPKAGEKLPPGAERTASGKIIYRGRLPNGFGKLGITYDQKQNIYRVQAEYDVKIDLLEQQLAKLKEEKKSAVIGLLSDRQKELLSGKDAPKEKPAGEPGSE